MELKDRVSENIRKIRMAKGISQNRLAELTKFKAAHLSRMENSPSDFTTKTIEKLAKGLGVPPSALLEEDPDETANFRLPKKLGPGISESIQALKLLLARVDK